MLLTTAMLTNMFGDKDKVATSLLQNALLPLTPMNGVLVLLEVALSLAWVVVAALLIPDLMVVSGFILTLNGAVTIQVLNRMPDFPLSKPTEEVPVPSASKVLSIPRRLDPKLLSASSTLALAQEALLSLALILVVRLLLALRRVVSQSLDMPVSSTALIQLNTVLPLDKRSAQEDVWVEVLVIMVFALATRVSRAKIAPYSLKIVGNDKW